MLDDQPLHVRITAADARSLAARVLRLDSVLGAQLSGNGDVVLEVQRPGGAATR
jgi:hypothetical protein